MNESKNKLLGQFMQVQWLFSRCYHQNHRTFGPLGNPWRGQGRVLKLLKMQPQISQKDLSEVLDMRPQSLGELLTKLERRGYITRAASESDKRVMMINLTDKGAETGDQEEELPGFETIFDNFSAEEQASLSGYLDRIVSEFEKRFAYEKGWQGCSWHGFHEHGGQACGFGHHGHKHGAHECCDEKHGHAQGAHQCSDEKHGHGQGAHECCDEKHGHTRGTHECCDEKHGRGQGAHQCSDEKHGHGQGAHQCRDEKHGHGQGAHQCRDEKHGHGRGGRGCGSGGHI